MMIPKTIHQIWVGGEVPRHLANMAARWQEVNPGWNYKLWRDGDFGWLQNQELFDMADRFAKPDGVGQMKSDIARYEILSRFGGVYMDMDMEPRKALDPLIDVRGSPRTRKTARGLPTLSSAQRLAIRSCRQ